MGASRQAQKSYRIDIKTGKGSWEEQKVVVLNKHAADPTKFRNKLAFDLMAEIPQMFSARTWFVHLYVKDRTEGKDGRFEDYGMYTAVEQINKRYLRSRELDTGGNIYKAVSFDWRRNADALTLTTLPTLETLPEGMLVLEVKFTEFLPALIHKLLPLDGQQIYTML